jgi:hypothetical protein
MTIDARCNATLKHAELLAWLCAALLIPVLATPAQSYKVDSPQSQALTTYLRGQRLPLVGAQVLTDSSGIRRIVLYGFVATEFGKNDAASKALAYAKNGALAGSPPPAIENRIEIRPEIIRMRTQGAPVAAADADHQSLDQVLNEIEHYGVTMTPAEPNLK